VLLVEDNATNQIVMGTLLQRLGCEVDIASDGAEALNRARADAYDVILMDLQMPVMDGLEATRAIRGSAGPNRATRIIGLTAAVGEQFEQQCREAGMDDYLSKPVQRAVLLRRLGSAEGPQAAGGSAEERAISSASAAFASAPSSRTLPEAGAASRLMAWRAMASRRRAPIEPAAPARLWALRR
jgi:CheY-like chemotaxis protein